MALTDEVRNHMCTSVLEMTRRLKEDWDTKTTKCMQDRFLNYCLQMRKMLKEAKA